MFGIARKLAALGILGINRRNAHYTLAHNPRRYYPLVDDKLRTKAICLQAGIPVPDLYGVVEIEHQVRGLPTLLQPREDFVVKPAHGSEGDGILVITGRTAAGFRTATGLIMDREELDHHVFSILSGLYSLGGQTDKAFFEYRVQFDATFEEITYQGVPDIRIIVFLGVPVMAMLRLPTRQSGGRANLHQGAIGVGIDLATGTTLKGVGRQGILTAHPDTGHRLQDLTIPHWQRLLAIAARGSEMTQLGYLGVDLVLDRFRGPLLLEVNARPGLAIQLANGAGLLPRLRLVEWHQAQLLTLEERLAFAQDRFAAS